MFSFGTFLTCSAHVPLFQISYSPTTVLASASSSYFFLAIPMREVSCMGYIPRAWDPRSLQCILDCPLYVELTLMARRVAIDQPIGSITKIIIIIILIYIFYIEKI